MKRNFTVKANGAVANTCVALRALVIADRTVHHLSLTGAHTRSNQFAPAIAYLINIVYVQMIWVFFQQMDSINEDLKFSPNKTIQELQAEANVLGAMAFNTLGYIKKEIRLPLMRSPFFSENDGLYIRSDVLDSLRYGRILENYQELELKTEDKN